MVTLSPQISASIPLIFLGYRDPLISQGIVEYFEEAGWNIHPAVCGWNARRLVRQCQNCVAILDTDPPGESGWLTCAKLVHEFPLQKVVLLTDNITPPKQTYAKFVGAFGLLDRNEISDFTKLLQEEGPFLNSCPT